MQGISSNGQNEYPSDNGIRRSCAAARGADIAARCPYHAKHVHAPGTPCPKGSRAESPRQSSCGWVGLTALGDFSAGYQARCLGPGDWTFSPSLAERDYDGSRGLEPTD